VRVKLRTTFNNVGAHPYGLTGVEIGCDVVECHDRNSVTIAKVERTAPDEFVTRKVTKVLRGCLIFGGGKNGLDLASVAVFVNVLFDHEIVCGSV
jgi:hypothetical protein